MIYQWYLFVLMAVVAIISVNSNLTYKVKAYGQTELRYQWYSVMMILFPMIYWAATRKDSGFGDTSAYRNSFKELPIGISNIFTYINGDYKDKGFYVFSIIIKTIVGNSDVLYFGIIAAICLACVACVYRKYSCNFMFSMFLFVASGEYIQWTYNGIRQFIAVAIIFAGITLILKEKYIPAIIIILVVSTIHASALLMIPIIFIVRGRAWNYRTVMFLLAVILAIAFLGKFTNIITNVMENSQYSNEVDQYLSTEGTNIYRVFVFAIPTVLSLVYKKRIDNANNPVIDLCVNMSIASLGMYIISAFTSGIFIGRIPIYFSLYNYILLPWLVENIFEKKSAKIVYAVIILFYMIFYYYQVHITWGL